MFLTTFKVIAFLVMVNVLYRVVTSYFAKLILKSGKVSNDGPFNATYICSNEGLLIHIQKEQVQRAKLELFGSTSTPDEVATDFQFYRHSYGAIDAMVSHNDFFNTIMYYRIYKNANDHIRSLLYNYAVFTDAQRDTTASSQSPAYRPLLCHPNECKNQRVHTLSGLSMKNIYYSPRANRFPFTFVRDPVSRFISAVKEIDVRIRIASRMKSKMGETLETPFQHRMGSYQRFQEFVRLVVSNGGSGSLFTAHKDIELRHLAPMIGTLILAHKVERGMPLRLYKVEEFSKQWHQLANDTGIPALSEVLSIIDANDLHRRTSGQRARLGSIKPSDNDPLNTSYVAKSYLSHASVDASNKFGLSLNKRVLPRPEGISSADYKAAAHRDLRAICRMYLTDYLCTGYTLPADCASLLEEVHSSADDYRLQREQLAIRKTASTGEAGSRTGESALDVSDYMRAILSQESMKYWANFYCFFATSPNCDWEFVYGLDWDHEHPERHDHELDESLLVDEHEEL